MDVNSSFCLFFHFLTGIVVGKVWTFNSLRSHCVFCGPGDTTPIGQAGFWVFERPGNGEAGWDKKWWVNAQSLTAAQRAGPCQAETCAMMWVNLATCGTASPPSLSCLQHPHPITHKEVLEKANDVYIVIHCGSFSLSYTFFFYN